MAGAVPKSKEAKVPPPPPGGTWPARAMAIGAVAPSPRKMPLLLVLPVIVAANATCPLLLRAGFCWNPADGPKVTSNEPPPGAACLCRAMVTKLAPSLRKTPDWLPVGELLTFDEKATWPASLRVE